MTALLKRIVDTKDRAYVGRLAGVVGILCNLCLFVGKMIVGTLSGSMAIAADAFNNLSDAGSSIVSLLGFWLGSQKADADHPFGHARYEYLASMVICVMIMAIGLDLGKSGVMRVMDPVMPTFGWVSISVMIGSVVVKLWLSWFNKKLGDMIDSDTLRATAADSRNDCISTSAVILASVFCHATDIVAIDGIMAVAVAGFILYSGYDLLKDALDPLLGRSPDPKLVQLIEEKVLGQPEMLGMHDLMVHDYGPGHQFASMHIEFAVETDALEAHELIDDLERAFFRELHIQVVIHYDPIVTKGSEESELRRYISRQLKQYDERLSFHDLRIVPGQTYKSVYFDLLFPAKYEGDQDAALNHIMGRVKARNKAYICVIKIDQGYV